MLALGAFAILTLGMLGAVLFDSGDKVLSSGDQGDLISQYSYWREFGFGELRHGHLPLWNPHIFCGAPFFGLQSGLLYPLNGLFLILPLAQAINWTIALHVFLAGAFTYLWALRRGLHPVASFVSGALFMFCGPHFLHIYAGHLPHLCAMIWPPLLFAAIDGVWEGAGSRDGGRGTGVEGRGSRGGATGWALLGMFAVAMQLLGGHPQYVLYTAVAAGIYCTLLLLAPLWALGRDEGRGARIPAFRFMLGIGLICVGGAALGAVQILTGLHDFRETWRGAGVSQEWAATYSLPPENFLTLLAPGFFGGPGGVAYWGRWKFWEMTLFVGVTGLVLAVIGAIWGDSRTRRFSFVMVVILFLLALGGYSPLFPFLYKWVPAFGALRGSSKFAFLAALFICMLAGIGLDLLIRAVPTRGERRDPKAMNLWWLPAKFSVAVCGAGLLLIVPAIVLRSPGLVSSSENIWYRAVLALLRTRAQNAMVAAGVDPDYVLQTAFQASKSLFIAAGFLIAIALLLALLRQGRVVVWLISGLAVIEVVLFAQSYVDSFDLNQNRDSELRAFLGEHPGDYRIFNSFKANAAMGLGAQDIWGYDPAIPSRYLQVLTVAHCVDPSVWAQFEPKAAPWLLDMLRLRFMFGRSHGEFAWREGKSYLPHVLLVQKYRVLSDPAQAISAVTNETFNAREEVILESQPDPAPQGSASGEVGSASITASTSDLLTVSAEVKAPSILLIADNYVDGWHARPLQVSQGIGEQREYRIMPANHCFCAIPLAAGRHLFVLEYLPREFVLGKKISILSAAVFLALVMIWAIVSRRKPKVIAVRAHPETARVG
ncbi:MAG: hypothetical protein C5B50_26970 [Verrucomicrobia bacterium]|nr:MAG: hypothetical protein C5B50_26970 [Verrucomicrobiota bacterium]